MNPTAQSETTSKLYIGGTWREPSSSETIDVIGAFSEEVIATVPAGTAADVDAAVAAANSAAPAWRELPPADRAGLCTLVAMGLQDRAEEIAGTISQELGSPITEAMMIQAGLPAITFSSMEHLVEEMPWEQTIGNSLVIREPIGTVGAITPWNYPLHQVCAKVAPAMLAGCTIVVKPSEVTPLSAFILASIFDEVGVPAGVFNLVTGTGPVVGEEIASHPGIDMVSFTGSTRAGRRVSELAAATVKPVTLELGGKSANVILDDADLEAARPAPRSPACWSRGRCCRRSRRSRRPSCPKCRSATPPIPKPTSGRWFRQSRGSASRTSSARGSRKARSSSAADPIHPRCPITGTSSSRPSSRK